MCGQHRPTSETQCPLDLGRSSSVTAAGGPGLSGRSCWACCLPLGSQSGWLRMVRGLGEGWHLPRQLQARVVCARLLSRERSSYPSALRFPVRTEEARVQLGASGWVRAVLGEHEGARYLPGDHQADTHPPTLPQGCLSVRPAAVSGVCSGGRHVQGP